MDIQAVSDGLAAAVDAAQLGLNCYGFMPAGIAEPAFYVAEVNGSYDQDFAGGMDVQFVCRLLVSNAEDQDGQGQLKAFIGLGPKSIKRAIEGTPGVAQTLGGVCDDVHVPTFRRYGLFGLAGDTYLGVEFPVRVIGDPEE